MFDFFFINRVMLINGMFTIADGDVNTPPTKMPMTITDNLTKHNCLSSHLTLNSKIVAEEDGFWQNYW